MSNQEIRTKLAAAREYLTERPAEAHYTDSPATARLTDLQGLAVTVAGPDGATLTTDMPRSVGGTNSAPSPGWLLRAAEASCVVTLIAMRAAQEGIRIKELLVTVDSESDDRGILGMSEDVPAGPIRTSVRVKVRGESDDDDDDLIWDSIVNWAVDHCPVTDAVRRAVPVTVEVTANEEG